MVFICKNYQYSLLITKAWVPATIWYFQLYFTVARQGKFLLIVSDTPHYRSDISNLNIGKYLASQSPYLSGLLRGQEMLSCGQRNEDILTQAGTCHTDNINGHSQPKHHTNHHHHHQLPVPWDRQLDWLLVILARLATISNRNKEIQSSLDPPSAPVRWP